MFEQNRENSNKEKNKGDVGILNNVYDLNRTKYKLYLKYTNNPAFPIIWESRNMLHQNFIENWTKFGTDKYWNNFYIEVVVFQTLLKAINGTPAMQHCSES